MTNTQRRQKQAMRLAAMASNNEDGITYVPTGQYKKDHWFWYGMTATTPAGNTWNYWLACDYGSYRGSFDGAPTER